MSKRIKAIKCSGSNPESDQTGLSTLLPQLISSEVDIALDKINLSLVYSDIALLIFGEVVCGRHRVVVLGLQSQGFPCGWLSSVLPAGLLSRWSELFELFIWMWKGTALHSICLEKHLKHLNVVDEGCYALNSCFFFPFLFTSFCLYIFYVFSFVFSLEVKKWLHFLNGISEINQLFDDILIIWPAPVYSISQKWVHPSHFGSQFSIYFQGTIL